MCLKSNTATEENPFPNDSALIMRLAETLKAKIPQLFLHKRKADHFRKHTTCQNILRQYHTISKIRGNVRSSVKKKTQEHIQFVFFLHMNDCAAELP